MIDDHDHDWAVVHIWIRESTRGGLLLFLHSERGSGLTTYYRIILSLQPVASIDVNETELGFFSLSEIWILQSHSFPWNQC